MLDSDNLAMDCSYLSKCIVIAMTFRLWMISCICYAIFCGIACWISANLYNQSFTSSPFTFDRSLSCGLISVMSLSMVRCWES